MNKTTRQAIWLAAKLGFENPEEYVQNIFKNDLPELIESDEVCIDDFVFNKHGKRLQYLNYNHFEYVPFNEVSNLIEINSTNFLILLRLFI